MIEKFWTCYVDGRNGGVCFKHFSLESAKQEAERLSRLPGNDGKVVYLMECMGAARIKLVEWEAAQPQDIPFRS